MFFIPFTFPLSFGKDIRDYDAFGIYIYILLVFVTIWELWVRRYYKHMGVILKTYWVYFCKLYWIRWGGGAYEKCIVFTWKR